LFVFKSFIAYSIQKATGLAKGYCQNIKNALTKGMKKISLLIASVAVVLTSCGGSSNEKKTEGGTSYEGQDVLKIDGSSTVYPISEALAEEFLGLNPTAKITVGVSGTGGGFKKFVRQEIDLTGASRPISKSEDSTCKAEGIEY
jgi:phosphate transport system substrate-binding protein